MAGKENINAFVVLVTLALILLLGHVQLAQAEGLGAGINAASGNGSYPEGCIRKHRVCPLDAGIGMTGCRMYTIPVLPCTCSEIKRCDPHASGCTEYTIAGPRSCGF